SGRVSAFELHLQVFPKLHFTSQVGGATREFDFGLNDYAPMEYQPICGQFGRGNLGPTIPPGSFVDGDGDGSFETGPLPGTNDNFGLLPDSGNDCNSNFVPDECDILEAFEAFEYGVDCNFN